MNKLKGSRLFIVIAFGFLFLQALSNDAMADRIYELKLVNVGNRLIKSSSTVTDGTADERRDTDSGYSATLRNLRGESIYKTSIEPPNYGEFTLRLPYRYNAKEIVLQNPSGKKDIIDISSYTDLCDDGTCQESESYEVCHLDCPSGMRDGFCDGEPDGRCDPDCIDARDPDCMERSEDQANRKDEYSAGTDGQNQDGMMDYNDNDKAKRQENNALDDSWNNPQDVARDMVRDESIAKSRPPGTKSIVPDRMSPKYTAIDILTFVILILAGIVVSVSIFLTLRSKFEAKITRQQRFLQRGRRFR